MSLSQNGRSCGAQCSFIDGCLGLKGYSQYGLRPGKRGVAIKRPSSRLAAMLVLLLCRATGAAFGQQLPDAPIPRQQQTVSFSAEVMPYGDAQVSFPAIPPSRPASLPPAKAHCLPQQCTAAAAQMCCRPESNSFRRFLSSEEPEPMTPRQKFHLAVRNVFDPFNLLTVGGTSAISVAANSHSAYGPGFEGWGKLSGVTFTQDMTNEFFGTFLIPSIAHQDPFYHRMPNASTKRRFAHALYQVVWTKSDYGAPMFNYATVVGTMAGEAVSDIYVPYREVGWRASSARIAISLATDPIGNLIVEFVPDLARHINFHVVFIQRIINHVAIEEGADRQP